MKFNFTVQECPPSSPEFYKITQAVEDMLITWAKKRQQKKRGK
jgi:hypothetical protein